MEAITLRKEDRRKERTRQLLRDALLELIPEKGYEDISLQDITDRANVARPTFYLHFKDKQDLLFSSLREIYDDLAVRQHMMGDPLELLTQETTQDDSDFEHVAQNADFYRAMLSDKGSIAFVLMVLEYLRGVINSECVNKVVSKNKNPRMPPDFISSFIAGAEIGVVNWWLKHDHMRHSPQQVSRMMNYLGLLGMNWALKLDLQVPVEEPDFSDYDHG